jgi:ABC-type antimicrobial peptide transport system permease subunit
MTFGRLLWRNLLGNWRGNLAVLLGVAVGAAVLTGALLVGDSLRGSLRDLTLRQLGWVDHVLISQRFIRQELADDLKAARVSPAIVLQGAANRSADSNISTSQESDIHVGRVTILGITDQFWPDGQAPLGREFWRPQESVEADEPQVVLNHELARQLHVQEGSRITLSFPKPTSIPRETLLGRREAQQVLASFEVKVAAVLPDQEPGAQFSLQPTSALPRNVFIPLAVIQTKLDQEARREGSNLSLKDRVNAIFAKGSTADLNRNLATHLTLDDWGLVLHDPDSRTRDLFARLSPRAHTNRLTEPQWKGRVARRFAQDADWQGFLSAVISGLDMTPLAASRAILYEPILTRQNVKSYFERRGVLDLESRQLLLDSQTTDAALAAAKETRLNAAPTLVYLADKISIGDESTSYAIVAALDPSLVPRRPSSGPSQVPPGSSPRLVHDEDILLIQTKRPLLPGKPGDLVKVSYYDPEKEDQLRTEEFRLAGFVGPEETTTDPFLTPEFPGITDRTSIDQWNPPAQIHFDNKRVKKPDDEHYWDEFRTTPKAYITLQRGEELWGKSRFGKYTSIRLAPLSLGGRGQGEGDLTKIAEDYRRVLLGQLNPERAGLVFDPVAEQRLAASRGGQDFGMLFLGFSAFLIMAGMLLVGLLFRLNLDRRASEVGLLTSTGFSKKKVRRLMLAEGSIITAVGGLVGLVGAVIYASLLLRLLQAWWPAGLEQSFLTLHLGESHGLSFVTGYVASFIVSFLTIIWAVRVLGKSSPRQLLAGEISDGSMSRIGEKRVRWSWWIAAASTVAALALAFCGPRVPEGEMRAVTFFSSGMLLLVGVLAVAWALLRKGPGGQFIRKAGGASSLRVASLGARNSARHPVRSILTLGLVASATFLLVAVQSFHREPERDFLRKDSGSGGCALLAETDVPIYQDLNNAKIRREQLNMQDPDQVLNSVNIYSFRRRAGDDVSCLNLYEARRPRLLGVPPSFIERGGFRFVSSLARSDDQRRNPWLLLEEPSEDNVTPAIADATTAEWVLHKKLGDIVEISDDVPPTDVDGKRTVKLRIVALLQDSVFQSELLLSEASFLKLFPRQEGYNFFLIETPSEKTQEVQRFLQKALAPQGVEVTESIERLRSYMAVENTYLLTFQALGGLGMLLGALGLAVVLLRSVWERRGELALLRALGFRKRMLSWLILAENGFLLILGLAGGTLAALLAVAPHLAGTGGRVPWLEIIGLLTAVLVVGLIAEAIAVGTTLKAPIVAALRQE